MGRTGTFRRREAQLTSVALLSQPQIFRIGHVLLPASMALVPQGKVGRPCQNRLNSRVEVPQSQSPGRWHCPAFLGVNAAVTSGCQSTISTADPPHQAPCSHHPPPTASQSPSSLFCHPVPLSHPMPCCHLLSPVHCLAAPSLTASTSLFPYLRASYSLSSSSLLSCLDLHLNHSRKPTGTAKKLESHFPVTSFLAHPAFTSSEGLQVM